MRDYLSLTRPGTLIGPALAGLLLPLAALQYHSRFSLEILVAESWRIILAMVVLAGANFYSNLLNQAWDGKEDAVNKPDRPIPSGRVSRDQVLGLAGLVVFFVLIAGFLVGPVFQILLFLIILAAYCYSAPPARLKRYLHLNNLSIATPRGALGVLAAWSVTGSVLDPPILAFAFILSVLVFGCNPTKDLSDIAGDRAANVRNWATEYGPRLTLIMVSGFTMLSGLYTLVFVYLGLLPQGMAAFGFAAGAGGYAILGMKPDAVWKGGNHPSWAIFYALLSLAIIIYSFSIILA